MAAPFVLDSYAPRSCPLKTANAFTPGLEASRDEVPVPSFFHDPETVETGVFRDLLRSGASVADLRTLRDRPSAEQEEAALAAMRAGVRLILTPLLPRDWDAHRSGRPSALYRVGDGYVPIVIKYHRTLETAPADDPPMIFSTLEHLDRRIELHGRRFRWDSRWRAAIQLAHLWRLLQATGMAASQPTAGIIGLERLADPTSSQPRQHLVVTWLDLDAPMLPPHPASVPLPQEAEPISTLQRYDYEFDYRVRLATEASEGRPLSLKPIINRECEFCRWLPHCETQLDSDDLSLQISKARLDPHEIWTLRSLGITSVDDLACADVDEILPSYLPRVSHRDGGEDRLRVAQHRARLIVDGIQLERTTKGPLDIPRHDLEIDLDIETSAEDHAYLWGFFVDDTRTGEQGYVSVASFDELDRHDERTLALDAFRWLRERTQGRDFAIYHYSDYEAVRVRRLLTGIEGPDADLAAWALSVVADRFVDLFSLVRTNFFGASGLGLKVVASAATGFSWRDEEPGGLASQGWFEDAIHAPTAAQRDAARTRVLEYNEDDVRATWHLRDYLRSLD